MHHINMQHKTLILFVTLSVGQRTFLSKNFRMRNFKNVATNFCLSKADLIIYPFKNCACSHVLVVCCSSSDLFAPCTSRHVSRGLLTILYPCMPLNFFLYVFLSTSWLRLGAVWSFTQNFSISVGQKRNSETSCECASIIECCKAFCTVLSALVRWWLLLLLTGRVGDVLITLPYDVVVCAKFPAESARQGVLCREE